MRDYLSKREVDEIFKIDACKIGSVREVRVLRSLLHHCLNTTQETHDLYISDSLWSLIERVAPHLIVTVQEDKRTLNKLNGYIVKPYSSRFVGYEYYFGKRIEPRDMWELIGI